MRLSQNIYKWTPDVSWKILPSSEEELFWNLFLWVLIGPFLSDQCLLAGVKLCSIHIVTCLPQNQNSSSTSGSYKDKACLWNQGLLRVQVSFGNAFTVLPSGKFIQVHQSFGEIHNSKISQKRPTKEVEVKRGENEEEEKEWKGGGSRISSLFNSELAKLIWPSIPLLT